eukprot:NODE_13869_length_1142_cov_2.465025.p3 GENE.NODE_13869_length_1142_cov_2.465025~~NODE_13869_length_1142_cov_2.465025.p3  ORF type:complete len:90 (+),score=20.70 NODE_13869_length_1142_cov_2.465025:658-927(+)
MCCDIRIPPQSFNIPELLAPGKALLIFITSAERGMLAVTLDGEQLSLNAGDSLVIRPDCEYCLRNDSDFCYACMKMVLVSQVAGEDGLA